MIEDAKKLIADWRSKGTRMTDHVRICGLLDILDALAKPAPAPTLLSDMHVAVEFPQAPAKPGEPALAWEPGATVEITEGTCSRHWPSNPLGMRFILDRLFPCDNIWAVRGSFATTICPTCARVVKPGPQSAVPDKFGPPQVGDEIRHIITGKRGRVIYMSGETAGILWPEGGPCSYHVSQFFIVSRPDPGAGDVYEKDGRIWMAQWAFDRLYLVAADRDSDLPISAAATMNRVFWAGKEAAHEAE